MQSLASESVDAIITDPPYPEIDRDYGRIGENEWHDLMKNVVNESRRILKPNGSAVFILQPNSEMVGRMRPWLWEFMAWTSREWNMVQDVWWWNTAAAPTVHSNRKIGLMRPSLKACVWLGSPDCFRNQNAVLWTESLANAKARVEGRTGIDLERRPSGQSMRAGRCVGVSAERGGVTPFNVLPIANTSSKDSGGSHGHGAATPYSLLAWWINYITQKGQFVCDPFAGTATTGAASIRLGRTFMGCEIYGVHYKTACERLVAESSGTNLSSVRFGQLGLLKED